MKYYDAMGKDITSQVEEWMRKAQLWDMSQAKVQPVKLFKPRRIK